MVMARKLLKGDRMTPDVEILDTRFPVLGRVALQLTRGVVTTTVQLLLGATKKFVRSPISFWIRGTNVNPNIPIMSVVVFARVLFPHINFNGASVQILLYQSINHRK